MPLEILILVGVSGSGKSTWSTKYIQAHPEFQRINRDSIRTMLRGNLDGYYQQESSQLNRLETLINTLETSIVTRSLNKNFSIVIDNTNLKPSYIERWVDFVKGYNRIVTQTGDVLIKFKLFPEYDANLLKKRVNIRDAPLGWDKLDYIDKQVASLKSAIDYVETNYKNQIIYE